MDLSLEPLGKPQKYIIPDKLMVMEMGAANTRYIMHAPALPKKLNKKHFYEVCFINLIY